MVRITLVCLLIFCSCDINNTNSDTFDRMKSAKAKWEKAVHDNYSFLYQSQCFCFFTEEVRVVVEADSLVQVLDPSTNLPVQVDLGDETVPLLDVAPGLFFTIDAFFDRLEVEIPVADEATAQFERTNGMPIEVSFDFIEEAIDDEITYTFRDLQIN